ncbi:MAG TPA: hypothetical protein VK463_07520 [Desulfomonilaceae bacterium]|nr:hypothetical protein [Desulfomonilaceae bacterium]
MDGAPLDEEKIQAATKPKSRDWKSIIALVVSVTSLVVSGYSAYYASIQSRYSRDQAESARAQAEMLCQINLPNIEVTQEIERNESTNTEVSTITISNGGGPLSEFSCEEITFLYIMDSDASKEFPLLADILLTFFYEGPVFTGRQKGVVCRLQSAKVPQYKKFTDVLFKFHEDVRPDGKTKLSADIITYLKVKYRDVIDRSHIDYLSVQSKRDMQHIDSKEWNSLNRKASVDLRTANFDDLKRIYSVVSKNFPQR